MFELTGFDPTEYRIESWRTLVMLDQVKHVREVNDRGRTWSRIFYIDGSHIDVRENVDVVSARIREYAETAQRERLGKMVADEIAKQFPEMADKAWRYEENSK